MVNGCIHCKGRPGCLLCALAEPVSASASAIDTTRIIENGCRRVPPKKLPDMAVSWRSKERAKAEIGRRRGARVTGRFDR